jgi:hypothetical protein
MPHSRKSADTERRQGTIAYETRIDVINPPANHDSVRTGLNFAGIKQNQMVPRAT